MRLQKLTQAAHDLSVCLQVTPEAVIIEALSSYHIDNTSYFSMKLLQQHVCENWLAHDEEALIAIYVYK